MNLTITREAEGKRDGKTRQKCRTGRKKGGKQREKVVKGDSEGGTR